MWVGLGESPASDHLFPFSSYMWKVLSGVEVLSWKPGRSGPKGTCHPPAFHILLNVGGKVILTSQYRKMSPKPFLSLNFYCISITYNPVFKVHQSYAVYYVQSVFILLRFFSV